MLVAGLLVFSGAGAAASDGATERSDLVDVAANQKMDTGLEPQEAETRRESQSSERGQGSERVSETAVQSLPFSGSPFRAGVESVWRTA